jgi:hypothetical protein
MHAVSKLEHPVLPRTVCGVRASDLADERELLGSADSGGEACLSGIEAAGDPASAAVRFPVADGRYAVRSAIVAWNEEPGALGTDGSLTPSALSDFVAQIEPELGTEKYRTKEFTFDTPL